MDGRAGLMVALSLIGAATPRGFGQSPERTGVAWINPAVSARTNGSEAEVAGCRWAFFLGDEAYATWFVRVGSTAAKAGVRGDYYLGAGWRIKADFGANLLCGLTVTARVEWYPAEGIMLAAELGRVPVRITWWQECVWCP